jgi:N-methylhydantoinase B
MAAENPRTGQRSISAIAPIVGGGGGMPHRDGTDGSGADAAYLKNSPVEITESEAPVRILRYGLMPDTGGPGAHRGGMAQVMEFRTTAPDAFVTARNRDRTLFQPWGIGGGQPGASGSFTLNPGTPRERDLGNTDALRLTSADTLRIVSPAGGGRGDPFTRDPAAVLRDHRAGLVSTAGAARDYGVAIAQDAVDQAATAALRAARQTPPAFAPGAFRAAHEARWTAAAYAALHEGLAALPAAWRPAMKATLFAAVRAAPEEPAEQVIRQTLAGGEAQAAE